MHFNWILTQPTDTSQKARSIELEYALRPRITKYLMERFEAECCGDFSCFFFDVHVLNNRVAISSKTPAKFRLKALEDFDTVINDFSVNNTAVM